MIRSSRGHISLWHKADMTQSVPRNLLVTPLSFAEYGSLRSRCASCQGHDDKHNHCR
jgi:hypothetical protein